jgi:hypothetical protein
VNNYRTFVRSAQEYEEGAEEHLLITFPLAILKSASVMGKMLLFHEGRHYSGVNEPCILWLFGYSSIPTVNNNTNAPEQIR